LDSKDQVNYDLYQDLLDTAVKGLKFHNDAIPIKGVIPHNLMMPVNQMEGVQQDIPRTFAMMPSETREDYEDIILRLQRVPALLDQTVALMEPGLVANMSPHRISFHVGPGLVTAMIIIYPMMS